MLKPTMKNGDLFTHETLGDYVVVDYQHSSRVKIKFLQTGYSYFSNSGSIRSGAVRDLLVPSVQGKGFLGGTEYSSKTDRKAHILWNSILQRCYNKGQQQREKGASYADCSVCDRWCNFQLFCSDLPTLRGYEQWRDGEDYHLDKDIKVPGNRVYAPETCMFVPAADNIAASNKPK